MRPFVENFPFFSIFLTMMTGIVCAALRNGRLAYRLTLCAALVAAVLNACALAYVFETRQCVFYSMGRFAAPFGNSILFSPMEALSTTAFSLILALSLLGGKRDLFADIFPEKQPFYFVMLNLLHATLLVLTVTNDIFTGYVFIEISTIAACALVMAKDSGPNLAAAVRYLFMSLFGSGLFLIGLTFLNGVTGYLSMSTMHEAVQALAASGTYRLPLTISLGLITAGVGIKSALFPFHFWLPDAHGGATTASSAILSGLVLKGYILLLITLLLRVFSMEFLRECGLGNGLMALGILGMLAGSVRALRERHIKRILACSSVAQIGYIYMGLGMGTLEGLTASCYHILVHACCKPLLFCCAGRLSAVSGHRKSLQDLRGSACRDVCAGVGFTIAALSMLGLPLLGGFVSKLYFASAALSSHWWTAALFAIAASAVLNALYYIPVLLAIWTPPDEPEEVLPVPEADWTFRTAAVALILGVFTLGIFCGPITEIITVGIEVF